MTTEKPSSDGCSSCDLAEIDELACTAQKFSRQAEVMNEVGKDLETYRGQYDDARKKYTQASDGATTAIEAIRKILEDLADQLRCRLTDDQRSCLEQSCEKVFTDIDECGGPKGCQSPCDDSAAGPFETSDDSAALSAEIQRRRANLAESAAYFTDLIGEPDTITALVLSLTTEANQLATDVAAGGDATHTVSWYARWLILDTSATMARFGRGFESVTAYLDCLCGVLHCLVSGWTIVAILEGQKAELDCHDKAKKARCDKEKADIVGAVLVEYECCCANQSSPTTPDEPTQTSTPTENPSTAS